MLSGERRVLRRPAGRDREPGPSAGIEVVANAVVVGAAEKSARAPSGDVAVADAVNERGTSAGRSSRSSSRVNGDVRPTGILVRRITNVRGRSTEGDPPPGPFGA